MALPENGMLLRIFIGQGDRLEGKPLYEQIVLKARELKLAGATVIRGVMGFGARSLVHTARFLRLSEDLPIIVELIDTEENLNKIFPFLNDNVDEGLITIEKATVIKYSHKKKDKG